MHEEREKLEPCPFCAEPAAVRVERHRNKPLLHAVFCTGPDCHTTTPAYTTRERAASQWNRRSTSASERGMREALEKAAKQFRFYEEEHTKKAMGFLDYGDKASSRASADKADTNRKFAELCDAALTSKGEGE